MRVKDVYAQLKRILDHRCGMQRSKVSHPSYSIVTTIHAQVLTIEAWSFQGAKAGAS